MKKVISQGAEAIIIKENNKIIKKRVKKEYRLNSIDEKIRRQRTKREYKLLEKSSKIIPVPKVISYKEKQNILEIEYLGGKKISQILDLSSKSNKICLQIGKNIASLHDNNIIHGDLTTSNMIFKDNKVYFIDFGLSYESNKIEDKAVDLHLIKQALEARHYKKFKVLFDNVIKGYSISKNNKEVLKRLENVEKRGRYKQQY